MLSQREMQDLITNDTNNISFQNSNDTFHLPVHSPISKLTEPWWLMANDKPAVYGWIY